MNASQRYTMCALLACSVATAFPDEDRFGKAQGYPPTSSMARTHEAPYIVGAFSGTDRISPSCELAPADQPVQPKIAEEEVDTRYRFCNHDYMLAGYVEYQCVTAILIVQDGVILAEYYSYDRMRDTRVLSNSMAKTLVALTIGRMLEDGNLRSLGDRVDQYVFEPAGMPYSGTCITGLLRMVSSARHVEDYTPIDDRARFLKATTEQGVPTATAQVNKRVDVPDARFNHTGAQTGVFGARAMNGDAPQPVQLRRQQAMEADGGRGQGDLSCVPIRRIGVYTRWFQYDGAGLRVPRVHAGQRWHGTRPVSRAARLPARHGWRIAPA